MRISPLIPPRRPLFGRRQVSPIAAAATVAGPTSDERRLIGRLIRCQTKGEMG